MDELVDSYSSLDIADKRIELAEEFTELIGLISKLKKDIGLKESVDLSMLKKLYYQNVDEDEYMKYIYSNFLYLKDNLADYIDEVTNLYYNQEDTSQ